MYGVCACVHFTVEICSYRIQMALYMNFCLLHTVDYESFAVSDNMDNVKFNKRKLCALLTQMQS